MLNKLSIVISVVVGLVLLSLFVADARRPQDRLPPPEETKEAPRPLDAADLKALKAALDSVVLPPPPAPAPAPEPAVAKVKPLPAEPPAPKPEPVVEVKPLKVEEPTPKPEPIVEVKPLKAEEPAPEAEIVEVKPLKAEEPKPAPEPEPTIEVKPLKAEAPKPAPAPEPAVEVEPIKVAARAPIAAPTPPARRTPTSAPAPAPEAVKTVHVSVATGGAIATEGRALLRLLEHGSGPTIEIAWPQDRRGQEMLYKVLAGCYGMRTVVMDSIGNLYRGEGQRGSKWDLNLDRFSGFVRQPSGWMAAEERQETEVIRRYHGLHGGAPVRVFPRQIDAVLLGGLQEILGARYGSARTIRATYRLDGDRLFVEGIRADGATFEGRVAFTGVGGRCRL